MQILGHTSEELSSSVSTREIIQLPPNGVTWWKSQSGDKGISLLESGHQGELSTAPGNVSPNGTWISVALTGEPSPGMSWSVPPRAGMVCPDRFYSSELRFLLWQKKCLSLRQLKYSHVEWRDLDKTNKCLPVPVPEFPGNFPLGSLAATVSYGFNLLKTLGSLPWL